MNLFNKIFSYEHDLRPLPEGFVHHRQSLTYLSGESVERLHPEVVGTPGCLGVRWKNGPLRFETFTSDIEPVVTDNNPCHVIIWEPIRRTDKPKGWCEPWIRLNVARTGFAHITNTERYDATWTEHARRHVKKWRKAPTHRIENVTLEAFKESYARTGKLAFLRSDFFGILDRRAKHHGDLLHLYGAINPATGNIDAGLAVLDLPDIHTSNHVIAFFHNHAKKTPVNVGLIDHWFRESIARQMTFLNFGVFWVPGEPLGWKGFSRFKSQFGLQYIDSPTTYMKFRIPKKTA